MKIALAQIDMRLGDIEGVCSRIESQALLANEQGAQLLCVPAPLLSGVMPGALADYANYEHDLVRALVELAAELEPLDLVCLVPAVVPYMGGSLMEVFILREGRAVPMRLSLAQFRSDGDPTWMLPVFDVAGARVAVTFEFERDLTELPPGCDLVVFFQVNGFDATDEATAAVAAVGDGAFCGPVSRAGVWLAHVSPVGGFDEAVYTGGSFVMDDGGRVVAAAPCFTEALLVQEVQRGRQLPALADHELPSFNREEWVWEALRLHLQDTLAAAGFARAVVPLAGDLPSSLLAVLAVDALGPRNVFGLMVEGPEALTPATEARERDRAELIREVASNLHIRLVERSVGEAARLLGRDVAPAGGGSDRGSGAALRLYRDLADLCLTDTARVQGAAALSPLTKSDAALRPGAFCFGGALVAPFGDIYLSALEFLARMRNRASAVLPARLVSLHAVEDAMAEVLADALDGCPGDAAARSQAAALMRSVEPYQVDGLLEAHVDRNLGLEGIPLAERSPEAAALLLMLVRRGEAARRRLPASPVVSARAFAERAWPMDLAWSDLGLRGAERLSSRGLAEAERERVEEKSGARGDAVRSEVLGLLGNLLGLTPEQQEELMSDENQRRMREGLQQFEEQIQEALNHMSGDDGRAQGGASPQGSSPFFSLN